MKTLGVLALLYAFVFPAMAAETLVRFEPWSDGPVITPGFGGAYDAQAVHDPEFLWDGTRFRLYYTAVDAQGVERIALALSDDTVQWTPFGVVLEPSGTATFDRDRVSAPSIIAEASGYQMYYTGSFNGWLSIGVISSPDGFVFDRAASPGRLVLGLSGAPDSFDWIGVSEPGVVHDAEGYWMMYQGHDGSPWKRLGLAFSPDGSVFSRVPGTAGKNAIFGLGPTGFDDAGVLEPFIFKVGDDLRLFYTSLHY